MALTGKDLINIDKLIKNAIKENNEFLLEHFVTKDEFNELKDIVIGIKRQLDTEWVIVRAHVDQHGKDIAQIKKHLGLIA